MKHLLEKLKELEKRDFDVVLSRGSLALHQTQRNLAKAEIIEAIYKDMKDVLGDAGYNVYQAASGPIIEFLNENVDEQISKMAEKDASLYTGLISIQVDAVMKNLDTNGILEEADYLITAEEKNKKAQEREAIKERKIRRDAEVRAERSRQREEEITRLKMSMEERKEKGE